MFANPVKGSVPALRRDRPRALAVYDPAISDTLIAELGADGKATWRDLVDSFIQDGSRLAAIRVAADVRNAEDLAFAAHALKSASATLGLLALSRAASQLEAEFQATPESFDVSGEAMKLLTEYHRATEALYLAREAEDGEVSVATE
jgi:HPt (histidine-containing phosphotransfer) domain-containing protein